MKRMILLFALFIGLFLCFKSGLGLGEKETFVDKIMGNEKEENQTNENLQIDEKSDSYYTDTKPVEITFDVINEKIINQQMLLLNKGSSFQNEELQELLKDADFDKNTYILISCNDKHIQNIESISLKKDNVQLNFEYVENNYPQTVLLEIKHLKMKNFKYLNIEYELLDSTESMIPFLTKAFKSSHTKTMQSLPYTVSDLTTLQQELEDFKVEDFNMSSIDFDKNFVLIIPVTASCGSDKFSVADVTVNHNINIYLDTYFSDSGTCDMAYWKLIIILDKQYEKYGVVIK